MGEHEFFDPLEVVAAGSEQQLALAEVPIDCARVCVCVHVRVLVCVCGRQVLFV